MAGEIELSIAETNKLRAQIGLPLIPDPAEQKKDTSSGDASSLTVDETNQLRLSLGLPPLDYAPQRESNAKKEVPLRDVKGRTREKSQKPPAKLFYDDVDTESWLDNLSAQTKTQESEKAIDIVESEDEETKVGHDRRTLALLKEGDTLTLRDSGILDGEGDTLENDTLLKEAKQKKDRKEREKQDLLQFGLKPRYDSGAEDSEEEPQEDAKLTGSDIILRAETAAPVPEAEKTGTKVQILLFDDDAPQPKPAVTMKKLKKTKRTSKKRQRETDELDEIKVDSPMVTVAADIEQEEDDIESVLASARNKKLKARKPMTAEEIANEVRRHNRIDKVNEIQEGFVYDDTKDFLDSLAPREELKPKPQRQVTIDTELSEMRPETAQSDEISNGKKNSEEMNQEKDQNVEEDQNVEDDSGADQTSKFSSLLSTLKYLREQNDGTLAAQREAERIKQERAKEAELERIQISIEGRLVKEELLKDNNYAKLTEEEQTRIYDRMLNDRLVSKGIVNDSVGQGRYSRYTAPKDKLENYNPEVKIRYKDARGNELDKKQAWKELLHKYHGLAPKHRKETKTSKSTGERVVQ